MFSYEYIWPDEWVPIDHKVTESCLKNNSHLLITSHSPGNFPLLFYMAIFLRNWQVLLELVVLLCEYYIILGHQFEDHKDHKRRLKSEIPFIDFKFCYEGRRSTKTKKRESWYKKKYSYFDTINPSNIKIKQISTHMLIKLDSKLKATTCCLVPSTG